MRIRTRLGTLLALSLLLAACEQQNALDRTLITSTQLSDYFTYGVSGLENVTDADRQWWVVTGDRAIVDVTPALSSGTAFLQIRGGNGEIVYAENIDNEVDGLTDTNVAGVWQIDIIYDKVSGGFSFELARDTVPSTP